MKISEKKRICIEFVDTEYWCKLDNDIMVQLGALEAQVRMLDIEPDLGSSQGLSSDMVSHHTTSELITSKSSGKT